MIVIVVNSLAQQTTQSIRSLWLHALVALLHALFDGLLHLHPLLPNLALGGMCCEGKGGGLFRGASSIIIYSYTNEPANRCSNQPPDKGRREPSDLKAYGGLARHIFASIAKPLCAGPPDGTSA